MGLVIASGYSLVAVMKANCLRSATKLVMESVRTTSPVWILQRWAMPSIKSSIPTVGIHAALYSRRASIIPRSGAKKTLPSSVICNYTAPFSLNT